MFKFAAIASEIMISLIVSCRKDKGVIDPYTYTGYGMLTLKTDKPVYTWKQGEGDKTIVIQGKLENRSETSFFSQVGDPDSRHSDLALFADNSAGKLEKLNLTNMEWSEINLLEAIIEGSKYIEIEPSKSYFILASLSVRNDKFKETVGRYRLKIAYYSSNENVKKINPFYDYSNTFDIRVE